MQVKDQSSEHELYISALKLVVKLITQINNSGNMKFEYNAVHENSLDKFTHMSYKFIVICNYENILHAVFAEYICKAKIHKSLYDYKLTIYILCNVSTFEQEFVFKRANFYNSELIMNHLKAKISCYFTFLNL